MAEEDFDKICRTCLAEISEAKSLFSVQYINQERLRLAQILTACTSLVVLENDKLPKQVCVQCELSILSTFNFQQQCRKSDYVLQSIITDTVDNKLLELKPFGKFVHSTLISSNSDFLNNSKFEQENYIDNDADNFNNEVNSLNGAVRQPSEANAILIKENESYEEITNNFENGRTDSTCNFNLANQGNKLGFSNSDSDIKKLNSVTFEDETMQPLFACEAKGCFSCFTTSADLKRHNRTHLTKLNVCKTCNKHFSSASTLSRHMTSKHQPEKKTHVCRECDKCFSRSDDLKRHIRVHTGERPFSCEKCGKAFAQSFRLLEHIRSHSNAKNFICAVCGKGFARYTSLLVHNKTHNQVKSHECTECGKRLCGSSSLSMHMKMHSGQKNFVCGFCKKRFASTSNLIVHKRTHTGERPYPCLTCGKSFPDNSRLNVHSRIHSGEKPYICTSCGRGCISSTQLKRHMRIHTGEKPFCCYMCSKCFIRSEDLKNHIKIHKGERNHICPVCSKGFFQRNTLKVHMRIHTGEKPFSCNVCHKTFSQSGPFSTHLKTHCAGETCTMQQIESKSDIANYL